MYNETMMAIFDGMAKMIHKGLGRSVRTWSTKYIDAPRNGAQPEAVI